MRKENYDIFISYRRTAYDTANLIAVKLRHAGYKVFFDIDTLTAGKFNEQLLEVIKGCKDFILVLPENALDRCTDPEDWVRREINCAIKNNKNILPVMLDGFSWPKELPEGMEELSSYQAITAVSHEYFDMAIERMQSYLNSKAKRPIHQWLGKASIAVTIILVLLGIGYGIISHIAGVTCKSIGTQLSCSMDVMDNLGKHCKDLKASLFTLYDQIGDNTDTLRRSKAEKDLLKTLDTIEKSLTMYRKVSPAPDFKFNSIENYVLAYYKVEQEELNAFSAFYDSMLDDMGKLIESVRNVASKGTYTPIEQDGLTTIIGGYQHYLNAFYYGYLDGLSLLPKSARKMHFDMARKWTSFPNGTALDLTPEEYEQFQTKEMEIYEEELQQQKEKELKLGN